MLQNFLQIAIRSLVKRKGYALLNIGGLALGIACCLLIFEYVAYEKSYDAFHQDADRIFRMQLDSYQNGKLAVQCATISPGTGPALKRDYPEVVNTCRLLKTDYLLTNNIRDVKFHETRVYFADAAILDMFHLSMIKGDPATALKAPGKILLSEDMAHKYFGQQDPVGQVLTFHDGYDEGQLQVSGVFRNYPANSHLALNALISYPTLSKMAGTLGKTDNYVENSWDWTDFYTYVELKKGADVKRLETQLPAFADKYFNDRKDNKNTNNRAVFSLVPLKNIHLYSHYTEEAEVNGDGKSVSFLFIIAFFIISIAWINYVNLATARSLDRAKEVGVRKVLGAKWGDLIRQFMMESLLLNILALLLAIGLSFGVNPFFSHLTGKSIDPVFSMPAIYWTGFAALFVTGTFLSGIYPAFFLSRYQPVAVLKGAFKNTSGGRLLRKGLIVGQFAVSIILIAGTIVVYRQLSYMRNQQLGVNMDHTLVLNGPASLKDSSYLNSAAAFKNDILAIKGTKSITASSNIMGQEILWSTDWHQWRKTGQAVNLFHLGVDYDFIPAYGLKMIVGRPFSVNFPTDKQAVVLNQSAVKALGYNSPDEALGQWLHGNQGKVMDSVRVIGVIADFHNEGLQKAIQPLVLLPRPKKHENFSIKIAATNIPTLLASLKKVWSHYYPADPFNYFFLDEFFGRQYVEDQRFGIIFGLFATLAIVIACFGLLGLSAYNVIQRTKEIGIRKVLGASVQQLLFILSKDFLSLVLIALLLAIPLTWWVMNSWLQGFAYRTAIHWWVFVVAGILAVLIAVMTVTSQALKAARTNPVKNLRTE